MKQAFQVPMEIVDYERETRVARARVLTNLYWAKRSRQLLRPQSESPMEIDSNDDIANDDKIDGMDELGIRVKLKTRKRNGKTKYKLKKYCHNPAESKPSQVG